ncbi:MAG TPA: hypothetical protein VFV19_17940 [Candidatus Polarisedimenticolaceae bacterium]|nr:hypothetical protein [Candidatus Polarisedimenticolaceae bacterium]
MAHRSLVLPLAALWVASSIAATPPATVNYQGVLRDQNDKPLSGTYDMTFRFMDAATAGNEILVDQHVAPAGVPVSGGLFNVVLGSGSVTDGAGPGTYATLDAVFRDYSAVWLEVRVGAETLAPRTRIQSAPYALNATNAVTATNSSQLNGQTSDFYLDTSSTYQTKSGAVMFRNYDPSIPAVAASCGGGSSNGFSTVGCSETGGYFETHGSTSTGVVAIGDQYGLRSYGGSVGGVIVGPTWDNYAYLGDAPDGAGIAVAGATRGVYYSSSGETYGDLGFFDGSKYYGLWAHGYYTGGYFENTYSGTHTWLADSDGTSVKGNGSKSFIQNHPERDDRAIVYAALEGDEVGTYTRGTARTVHGEAHVSLGDTFRYVTDPDLGLTVYVTPIGAPSLLYVAEKSTTGIVVKTAAGEPDVAFDWIAVGLRVGFENVNVVREKTEPSPVPTMTGLLEEQARHPELAQTTSRARFEAMERAAGREVPAHARTDALLEQIRAADHGVTESPSAKTARLPGIEARRTNAATPASIEPRVEEAAAVAPPAELVFPASEPIDAGDLLALDPETPGALRRAVNAEVVGVADAPSRIVDGSSTVAVTTGRFAMVAADAGTGAIHPGDLLTASATPGRAMKARPEVPAPLVGRALTALEAGQGLVRVLLP